MCTKRRRSFHPVKRGTGVRLDSAAAAKGKTLRLLKRSWMTHQLVTEVAAILLEEATAPVPPIGSGSAHWLHRLAVRSESKTFDEFDAPKR